MMERNEEKDLSIGVLNNSMEISKETRNIGQIIRIWGGSKYMPLTKFLPHINLEKVQKNSTEIVHVSIGTIKGVNAIIITKDRIPDDAEVQEEKLDNQTTPFISNDSNNYA